MHRDPVLSHAAKMQTCNHMQNSVQRSWGTSPVPKRADVESLRAAIAWEWHQEGLVSGTEAGHHGVAWPRFTGSITAPPPKHCETESKSSSQL